MVAGISLLDAIANASSDGSNGTAADVQVRVANELVAAALDEYRHIEALDACGPRGKGRRLYVRETEVQMRRLHEAWLSPASELLARMKQMSATGHPIEQLNELEDAVWTTRGLLMMTLDQIEAGREQIRQGNYFTLEEVRRELRAQAGK